MAGRDFLSGSSSKKRQKRTNIKKQSIDERNVDTIEMIEIDKIASPKFHDRSYISRASIDELAENIHEVGQIIEPIVIRELSDGTYERVAGYRRIEAAKQLGWEKVPAKILIIDEAQAILIMISENLQRENLNAYDEVYSIVQFLSLSMDMQPEEMLSLLYRVRNYNSGNIMLDDVLEKQMDEIESILTKIAKYNLGGFTNKLKVLKLEKELIAAMRERNLSYSYAILINQVKFNKPLMLDFIEKSINKEIDYEALQLKVKEAKGLKNNTKETKTSKKIDNLKRVKKLMAVGAFKKLSSDKQEEINTHLIEIEKILSPTS